MDTPVQCQICLRTPSDELSFNCVSCARNAIYESRIHHASVLLEKEALGDNVEDVVKKGEERHSKGVSQNFSDPREGSSSNRWILERCQADKAEAEERTQDIQSQIEILREEIEESKAFAAERRDENSRRRAALDAAKLQLSKQQVTVLDPLKKEIRKSELELGSTHSATVEARIMLCRETADLWGFQQRKRRKGSLGRETYVIAGIPIIDLRDLNNAKPVQISVSATNLAQFTHLISNYLALRLPAEIILPVPSNPLPSILSPTSSYKGYPVTHPSSHYQNSSTYPGTPGFHRFVYSFPPIIDLMETYLSISTIYSPSSSQALPSSTRSTPHPRPLTLDKPLPILAKEDSIAYSHFVEGITLLAWDIAWLCKTQGLPVGDQSWEDICAMGKNLYELLSGPSTSPTASPAPPGQRSTPKAQDSRPIQSTSTSTPNKAHPSSSPTVSLGHFSHGTSHTFLNSAEGAEYMRGWKLQSSIKVIENVRTALERERMGADWELLEGDEWEDEGKAAEDVKENGKGATAAKAQGNVIAAANARKASEEKKLVARKKSGEGDGDERGIGGWMKLKSRLGE